MPDAYRHKEPAGDARNEPCSCGSGVKAKRCPGLVDAREDAALRKAADRMLAAARQRVCPICGETRGDGGAEWCPSVHDRERRVRPFINRAMEAEDTRKSLDYVRRGRGGMFGGARLAYLLAATLGGR